MENSLGFIGGGRITNIFLQAFNNKNISLKNICVFDTNKKVSKKLKQKFPEISISDLKTAVSQEIVFIALHPPAIMETLATIKEFLNKNSIIISLAPKITIKKISQTLGNKNIVRLIPNATSVINEAYNPVCFAPEIEQKPELMKILLILGKTFETEEHKLEAYAMMSAMLPTYFWFQWYEMIEIAQQMGLSETESFETVEETLISSLNTMFKSGLNQQQVIDLIPVKPIGEHENEIREIYRDKLIALFNKIKS
ncbi:MAG: NAD(P)-binding domain-containing protein [Bacteroidota bacterium]